MPSRVLYHCPCSTGSSPCIGTSVASSSTHLLQDLYFCEECDSIRCNLCTNNEVAVFYCPNCLFDVPVAGIKSEKARCARNCFICPVCTSVMSVTPSDLGGNSKAQYDSERISDQDDWNPRSNEASIGEPPYYLACPTCKWDSKEIGMTFEKNTGLSLQVQRQEETAMDVVEFNQIRAHFEAYIRTMTDHQQTNPSSLPAAARSSKLLRDVPSLANDPLFLSRRYKQPKAEAAEELKPYIATSSWNAGRKAQKVEEDREADKFGLGRIGQRDENRYDFASMQQDEGAISGLAQRWQSPSDQSLKLSDLRPCRVPLKTKQTKRCPTCRHIIIKSEAKAISSRYKIKLMALNYLPEIQINPLISLGSSMTTTEEKRRSSALHTSRRREVGPRLDEEGLRPGRIYLFEASFVNPLDDAMTMDLIIAEHHSTTLNDEDAAGDVTISPSKREALRESAKWTVTPTTSVFPVSAFNEVWELDDEDNDLIDAISKNRRQGDLKSLSDSDEDDDLDDDFDKEKGDVKAAKRTKKKKGDGILKRKGNETTIGLELSVGSNVLSGDVEFAMKVTYHYTPDVSEEGQRPKKGETKKSFSFWTIVRLGHISSDTDKSDVSGMPNTSAEARRSALDKRRSIMGINVAQSGTSTLSSLLEPIDLK